MKRFTLLVACLLALTSLSASAQAYLKDELSAESFKPLTITTPDGVLTGYGFINPLSYRDIVYTATAPTGEKVKDWKLIKDIVDAKIYDTDTISLVPTGLGKSGKIKVLCFFMFENDQFKLYESSSDLMLGSFFIQPKNISDPQPAYKLLVIRNQGTFKKFTKKSLSSCPALVSAVAAGQYEANLDGLIQLLNDHQEQCPEAAW